MSKEVIIKGSIIKGKGLGRKLGFPTVNILYNGCISGVFVGKIFLDDKWCEAVIHVGKKPTVKDENNTIEVYILNWNAKMQRQIFLNQTVSVKLLYKIRDTQNFGSLQKLKEKISQDVEFAKNWYNKIR